MDRPKVDPAGASAASQTAGEGAAPSSPTIIPSARQPVKSPARHAGIARSDTEADDHFARSFGRALNGRSSSGQGLEDRKDNTMIAVALVIAWLAVVGLVLIARGDYRQRRPIR